MDLPGASRPYSGMGNRLVRLEHFLADLGHGGLVGPVAQGGVHPAGDELHLGFLHAAGGDGGGADPDARGLEGGVGVEGDAVLVDGDAGPVQGLLGLVAQDALLEHVHQHQVVVGAAGDDAPALAGQGRGQGGGVATTCSW